MNAFALICPQTGASLLVDPGAEPDALQDLLAGSRPVGILLTHSHPDHLGALAEMRQRLHTPLMAHPGPHFEEMELDIDRPLADGELIQVGAGRLRVRHAPGHLLDQVCYELVDDPRVLVGDTIFAGGPGRTWSSAGFRLTLETLRRLVLPWPDEMRCFPGHGPAFNLGAIRPAIERFLAADHGDFFGDATWDM